MGLPANTSFTWQIQGLAPLASMDALIDLVGQGDPALGSSDGVISISETRTFTTAGTP